MGGASSVASRGNKDGGGSPKRLVGSELDVTDEYCALGDYFADLKTSGLSNAEMFDALKRREEHYRQQKEKKRAIRLQSRSIKALALNQLSQNLQGEDEFRKIGFISEKVKHQLKSAKETVHGLREITRSDVSPSRAAHLAMSGVEGKIKEAEMQVEFLTHVQRDLIVELSHLKKSEKTPRRSGKSVKPFVALRSRPMLNVRVNSESSCEADPINPEVVVGGGVGKSESAESSRLRNSLHFGDISIGERGLHSVDGLVRTGGATYAGGGGGGGGGVVDFLEVCLLGCGASATVREAIHVPSFTIVALKMMPIYNQEKRDNVGRELAVLYRNLAELSLVNAALEEEGLGRAGSSEMTRSLSTESCRGTNRSNHVLTLYDAFADPKSGLINLVVEYMDGGSLADLVQNGGCQDEGVIQDLASQVLKGLYFLHSKMQIHRDIKPGNILLNSRGQVKLADFGISKALSATVGFASSFIGTVTYMSPERITGSAYSYPSDVWSFGLTLLAVCRGRYPIETSEGGYWGLVKSISDEPPPTLGPPFGDCLCSFIDACLKKDPADRLPAIQLLKHPFVLSTVSSLNKVRTVTRTRRSSEGQLALGKAIKTSGVLDDKPIERQRSQRSLDEEDEDVEVTHLHRILDCLEDRASELEEEEDEEEQAEVHMTALSVRGSTFGEKPNEESRRETDVSKKLKPSLIFPAIKGTTGIAKWRHLATQLQLPLDVVLLAAKKRISERFLR